MCLKAPYFQNKDKDCTLLPEESIIVVARHLQYLSERVLVLKASATNILQTITFGLLELSEPIQGFFFSCLTECCDTLNRTRFHPALERHWKNGWRLNFAFRVSLPHDCCFFIFISAKKPSHGKEFCHANQEIPLCVNSQISPQAEIQITAAPPELCSACRRKLQWGKCGAHTNRRGFLPSDLLPNLKKKSNRQSSTLVSFPQTDRYLLFKLYTRPEICRG